MICYKKNLGEIMNELKLDHIDKEILNLLQKHARMSLKEIAAKVFLSSPAVSTRIDKLMKEGYIDSFQAHLNPIALSYHIKAFINLEVEPIQKSEFYPFIESIPNVIECNCVTGDYAMLISVLFQSTADLDRFINQLQQFGRTKTQIVFSTSVKHRGVVIE